MDPAVQAAIELIKEKDLTAAVEELSGRHDPKVFLDCMLGLYWKQKDLPSCIAIGQAGIGAALSRGASATEEDANKSRSMAKSICFNLASFTWDGWDEPGFTITPAHLAIGLDAAKANLRLAIALNKGDLPLSRAYWMLAGHELSAGKRAQALEHYQNAQRHAQAAKSTQDALLNEVFASMTELLNDPQNTQTLAQLESVKDRLKNEKDGPEFIRQVETAYRVFSKST